MRLRISGGRRARGEMSIVLGCTLMIFVWLEKQGLSH